ncbi:exodeoxyribonuclease VII large subunit [Thermosyntropha sp.]|uniref:exodeoxyribonuclease VII large subunit n=1 Tax=Thermosyntropha sp. TaxID=2740820 RepID=UPI0025CBED71|nr:exodeoxyribonuclease VII large subunit [Thermosyntropha sp.]MBO8159193.1 exodeoxyribonuclease VII large subunit [Thermosyntropha sp.]
MPDFITVTQLNNYINEILTRDPVLSDLWIKGEISGFKLYQQSGHMYFTLKDKKSTLSCVMFKNRNLRLNFIPEDGQEVLVRGRVSVYPPQGKYQLYVEEMQPYGVGGLFLYLNQLKERLEKEGYFDQSRKKTLPFFPRRIGIVTSQDGAALRDMWRILKSRHPGIEVLLVHSAVQGMEAPYQLAEGIRLLNEYGEVDLIIIGRGGGSVEDLKAFNTEEVVKAVYESEIPVISAVGHEVDFSLTDLAADVRAATPTQAAQMAVPDFESLRENIKEYQQRLIRLMERRLLYYSENLDNLMMRKIWQEPEWTVKTKQDYLHSLNKDLIRAVDNIYQKKANSFMLVLSGLEKLSPLNVLKRGYAVLMKDGNAVRNLDNIKEGDLLTGRVAEGYLILEVKGKEKEELWKI